MNTNEILTILENICSKSPEREYSIRLQFSMNDEDWLRDWHIKQIEEWDNNTIDHIRKKEPRPDYPGDWFEGIEIEKYQGKLHWYSVWGIGYESGTIEPEITKEIAIESFQRRIS